MKAKLKSRDPVVVDVGTQLTIGATRNQLDRLVEQFLRGGRKDQVLDLARTTKVDAAGIGELIRLHNRFELLGGRLYLVRVQPWLKYLLELVRVLPVLHVYDSEREVVASLGAAGPHSYFLGLQKQPDPSSMTEAVCL